MNSEINIQKLKNYKGIHFYNNEKEIFYEKGAHFSFKDICLKLNKLHNHRKIEGK